MAVAKARGGKIAQLPDQRATKDTAKRGRENCQVFSAGGTSAPQSFLLSPGVHTLTVAWREPGVQLDKWFLVQTDEMPEGRGGLPIEECPDGMAGPDTSICPGTCTEIGMEPDPDHPEYCYTWMPQEGVESPYSSKTRVCPLQTTTYTLHITNDDGELIGSDEVTVEVKNFSISMMPEFSDICPGGTAILEVVPSGGSSYSYLWNTGETTSTIEVSPERTTIFSVEVTDNENGCTLLGEAQVNVLKPPVIQISSSFPEICKEAEVGIMENIVTERSDSEPCNSSTFLYAGTGLAGYSYQWSNGKTEPLISVSDPGLYTVTVTKDGGCSSVVSYYLGSCAEVAISSAVIQTPDGAEQTLLDAGPGYIAYQWQDGSTGQTINVSGPGPYAVTVVNSDGCTASDQYSIEELKVDPSDGLLVFNTDGETEQNIFLCTSAEYNEEDKLKIQKQIEPRLSTISGLKKNYIWSCSANHSNDLQIAKNSQLLELIPFLIQNTEIKFRYYDPSTREYPFYQFKLNIDGIEYTSDAGTPKFNVNFSSLDDAVEASLSIQDETGSFIEATIMNIKFRPEGPAENPYVLFYEGQEAPETITVEEKTTMLFQIKQRMPDGTLQDPVLSDLNKIAWEKDGKLLEPKLYTVQQPGVFDGHPVIITYGAPSFSEKPEENEFTFGANVNYLHDLLVTLIIQNKTVTPEYFTVGPPDDLSFCDKGGAPLDYLEEAKKRVKMEHGGMYDALIQDRMVEIHLTDKEHPELPKTEGNNVGYGSSSIGVKGDPRIFIDPNKTDKGEKRYADCYIDGDLLIKITRDEYGQIRNEIQDLAPEDEVPSVINRISTLYPEVASKLAAWCELEDNSDLNKILVQVDNWDTDNKLAYIPTTEELNSLINVPNIAYIYLSVDNLCEIPNYTNLCYTNNILIGDSKSVVQSWYDGISDADSKVHELRNKQYTRILAHEMGHIFYAINNKIESYKWSLLINLMKSENVYENCLPGKGGTNKNYCSTAGGHEFMNPEGLQTCTIQSQYSTPCLNR